MTKMRVNLDLLSTILDFPPGTEFHQVDVENDSGRFSLVLHFTAPGAPEGEVVPTYEAIEGPRCRRLAWNAKSEDWVGREGE